MWGPGVGIPTYPFSGEHSSTHYIAKSFPKCLHSQSPCSLAVDRNTSELIRDMIAFALGVFYKEGRLGRIYIFKQFYLFHGNVRQGKYFIKKEEVNKE